MPSTQTDLTGATAAAHECCHHIVQFIVLPMATAMLRTLTCLQFTAANRSMQADVEHHGTSPGYPGSTAPRTMHSTRRCITHATDDLVTDSPLPYRRRSLGPEGAPRFVTFAEAGTEEFPAMSPTARSLHQPKPFETKPGNEWLTEDGIPE